MIIIYGLYEAAKTWFLRVARLTYFTSISNSARLKNPFVTTTTLCKRDLKYGIFILLQTKVVSVSSCRSTSS